MIILNKTRIELILLICVGCSFLIGAKSCNDRNTDTKSSSSNDNAFIINAPSNLTANTVSPSQINLSWDDNSNNEDGFRIERSLDGTDYELLITTSPNVIAYANSGLNPRTSYYYRVNAFYSGGDTTYSNVIAGFTALWTNKTPSGLPYARDSHSMVWDGTRTIMFGGNKIYSGIFEEIALVGKNDLWWYEPVSNTWTQKISQDVSGSPSARVGHSMVWDGQRVIMFGGRDISNIIMNDLWWYDPASGTNGDWLNQTTTAASPTARSGHSMVWDGIRVILFGGSGNNDLWWYESVSNTWIQKIAQSDSGSPSARVGQSMVWDGQKVIMFGGLDSSYNLKNDLWWYNPATNTWTEKIIQNILGSPSARWGQSMVWDGRRVIMFGGHPYSNDLWWYESESNTWTQKIAQGDNSSPLARYNYSMIWDGTRVILFGGRLPPRREDWWFNDTLVNDVWWW